jgi:hypothetical protein
MSGALAHRSDVHEFVQAKMSPWATFLAEQALVRVEMSRFATFLLEQGHDAG